MERRRILQMKPEVAGDLRARGQSLLNWTWRLRLSLTYAQRQLPLLLKWPLRLPLSLTYAQRQLPLLLKWPLPLPLQ